jgi:hypothetical protein
MCLAMRQHNSSSVKGQLVVMSSHMPPSHIARISDIDVRTEAVTELTEIKQRTPHLVTVTWPIDKKPKLRLST